MNFLTSVFILLFGINICVAGYGIHEPTNQETAYRHFYNNANAAYESANIHASASSEPATVTRERRSPYPRLRVRRPTQVLRPPRYARAPAIAVSDCDFRNLGFNGVYQCSGNLDMISCEVSCPSGARFSSPPAEAYVCEYATGVFLPQPIPQCVYSSAISACVFRNQGFNGDVQCSGNSDMVSCKLSCPSGKTFNSPAAEAYVCEYATGVFLPQPIPKCIMKCPEGKIYNSCGPDTEASCAFPHLVTKSNTSCVEGCFCPEGLFLESGRCVQKSECPCRLRDRSFPPGTVIPNSCNTCECGAGEWVCTELPCGARCEAMGDPHYTTFDGRRFDFMGECVYTLLKTENITIEAENVACFVTETFRPACIKAVYLQYLDDTIHLKQGGVILANGKEVTSLPAKIGDISIRAASSLFIMIQFPGKVTLTWDRNNRVFVDVPPACKTQGLCGTFNLNQTDDFLTPEGDVEQSVVAFANRWKTNEFCKDVSTTEQEHPCNNIENKDFAEKHCSKLKSSLFESCHWYVDVQPYYEDCLYDMCACVDDVERCLCPIVGGYADACASAGVKIQWRHKVKECELKCTGGQEYTVCADSCLRTCNDVGLPIDDCKPSCVEGCACPTGQVLYNDVCVPVAECPCYHKGMEFKSGYKEVRAEKRECELCECTGGNKWHCTERTCAGVCSVWGDSHVTSFDGQTYDFEGVCSYLLARGVMDGTHGFSVEIQNEPCGTTGATCSKSIKLRVGTGSSEETVSLTKSAPLPDTSKLKSIKLREAGAYVFLDVLSRGMSVQWDRGLRVYVRVDYTWDNKVEGLCGNYNADMRDDLQTPWRGRPRVAETSPLLFVDDWKLKTTCPKPQEVTDHCVERPNRKEWAMATCGAMKRYPFSLCHSKVSPSEYVSRCEADACACDAGGDCECACAALAAYAHACAARGVTFKWRTQNMCPMQCDEEGSNYHECISPCPPETCDNYLDYIKIKAACEKETCVEGCKRNESKACPPGTLYYNSSLTECVPRAKCLPPCMFLEDSGEMQEGEEPCLNNVRYRGL